MNNKSKPQACSVFGICIILSGVKKGAPAGTPPVAGPASICNSITTVSITQDFVSVNQRTDNKITFTRPSIMKYSRFIIKYA